MNTNLSFLPPGVWVFLALLLLVVVFVAAIWQARYVPPEPLLGGVYCYKVTLNTYSQRDPFLFYYVFTDNCYSDQEIISLLQARDNFCQVQSYDQFSVQFKRSTFCNGAYVIGNGYLI